MKLFSCLYLGSLEVKKAKVQFSYIRNKSLRTCRIGKHSYSLLGNVETTSFTWLGRTVGNHASCLALSSGPNWSRESRKINSGSSALAQWRKLVKSSWSSFISCKIGGRLVTRCMTILDPSLLSSFITNNPRQVSSLWKLKCLVTVSSLFCTLDSSLTIPATRSLV